LTRKQPDNQHTIAISGGSRGIGRAIAQCFARVGWRVAVAARSAEALAKMHTHWAEAYPDAALLTHAADLSTAEGCRSFAQAIEQKGWTISVLVNNLGTFAPGTLLEGEEDQLANFLQTNLLSAHYLTRSLMPQLRSAERAHLFTIGSVAVFDRPAPMAAYMLSKHVLHAWHESLRTELTDTGVLTTLLVPGATYTSSWDGIEVDPRTLLAPETIANTIWDAWQHNQSRDTEQIIIRPKANDKNHKSSH